MLNAGYPAAKTRHAPGRDQDILCSQGGPCRCEPDGIPVLKNGSTLEYLYIRVIQGSCVSRFEAVNFLILIGYQLLPIERNLSGCPSIARGILKLISEPSSVNQ